MTRDACRCFCCSALAGVGRTNPGRYFLPQHFFNLDHLTSGNVVHCAPPGLRSNGVVNNSPWIGRVRVHNPPSHLLAPRPFQASQRVCCCSLRRGKRHTWSSLPSQPRTAACGPAGWRSALSPRSRCPTRAQTRCQLPRPLLSHRGWPQPLPPVMVLPQAAVARRWRGESAGGGFCRSEAAWRTPGAARSQPLRHRRVAWGASCPLWPQGKTDCGRCSLRRSTVPHSSLLT